MDTSDRVARRYSRVPRTSRYTVATRGQTFAAVILGVAWARSRMIFHTNESTIAQNWNRRVLAIGAVGRSLHYHRLCFSACPTIPILRDFEENSQPAALRLERTRDRLPHCRFQLHDAMSSYLRCQGARARVPPVASMPRAFWKNLVGWICG